jgi:hypothetical protein
VAGIFWRFVLLAMPPIIVETSDGGMGIKWIPKYMWN